jgi:two-component system, response regulator PdtaR
MKLLIVEDEMIIAMRLEQLVTDLGHQVCAMASTEAGAIPVRAPTDPTSC